MSKLSKIGILKPQAGATLLGLTFDEGVVEVADVRRTNGSVELRKAVTAPLSLNLLTDAPELVGREIRKQLDAAGIRERRCAVCLPLGWALTQAVALPNLPEADQESVLQIEAERGFPCALEELQLARSRFRTSAGGDFGMLVAIPREHVQRLEAVLRSAQLRPVSFSLALPVLRPPTSEGAAGVLALAVGSGGIGLQVTCGNGLAVLRRLASGSEPGASGRVQADLVAREIRITLGQLPDGLRDTVRRVEVYGSGEAAESLVQELYGLLRPLGLTIERVKDAASLGLPLKVPAGAAAAPGLAFAVRLLAGERPGLELLPPRVSSWQRFSERHASRKLALAGAVVGGIALLLAAVFLIQEWQLSRWQSRWTAIRPRATELERLQQQIKACRPWFDESVRSLSILRRLAEAFPEDGSVSAKTLELRGASAVTCSGTARDSQSLLRTLDRLRACKEVSGVKVDQIRGRTPVQFTFNFQWIEAAAP